MVSEKQFYRSNPVSDRRNFKTKLGGTEGRSDCELIKELWCLIETHYSDGDSAIASEDLKPDWKEIDSWNAEVVVFITGSNAAMLRDVLYGAGSIMFDLEDVFKKTQLIIISTFAVKL